MPRFNGPYKVVKLTKKRNYILEDALGNKLPGSIPLHKI